MHESQIPVEVFGVEIEVLMDEGGNIPETVIVSKTSLEYVVVVRFDQLVLQVIGKQLIVILIVASDIHEERCFVILTALQNLCGIISQTFLLGVVEEEVESFDSPCWTFGWVSHRCECRNRTIVACF